MSLRALEPHDRHPAVTPEPSGSLEAVLARARSFVLLPPELEELVRLACAAGRAQSVVVDLLRAGTAAARANVLAARGLRGPRPARSTVATAPPLPVWHAELNVNLPSAPFDITAHAYQRYVERFPGDAPDVLRARLVHEISTSGPLRERTTAGDEQWRSARGVVFIVKRDGSDGGNRARPVCVTVLPPALSHKMVSRHRRQRRA